MFGTFEANKQPTTMADLDDFFAKKDRKKSKTTKSKFTTPEELVKKIEDTTSKKPEPKPKQQPPPPQPRPDGAENEEPTVVEEVS